MIFGIVILFLVYILYGSWCYHRFKRRKLWRPEERKLERFAAYMYMASFVGFTIAAFGLLLGVLELPPMIPYNCKFFLLSDTLVEYSMLIIMAPLVIFWLFIELIGALFFGRVFGGRR